MPGAVFNEDHYALDVTKGLWNTGSAAGNDVPDGYCRVLENFIADGNRLRVRPNFSTATNWRNNISNTTPTTSLELIAYYKVYESSRRMWAVGGGVNQPKLIWQAARGNNVNQLGSFLSDDVGNVPINAHGNSYSVLWPAKGFIFTGFNQFSYQGVMPPIIYGSTLSATNAVKRFGKTAAWNPTNGVGGQGFGTVSIDDIIGSPPMKGLVFFRDRMFGWNTDVIYWTELALTSPGGVPEAWNPGTNFARVPSNLGGIVIHEVMPFNDRLIIFTNAGLFSLRTQGDPKTDWVWNTIDENIKVQAQVQCTQMRGTIYYVDDMGVWSYNGDSFGMVSASISNYFDTRYDVQNLESPVYNIYPTHDGLLLTVKTPQAISAGGWRWDVSGVIMLYYNIKWNTWCVWKPNGNYDLQDVMGAVSDHRSMIHGGNATNWIMMRMSNMASNTQVYEVDFAGFSGELYDPTNSYPPPGTSSADIECYMESATVDIGNPHRIKGLKYAFLDTYHFSGIEPQIFYEWWVESNKVIEGMVDATPTGTDGTMFTKMEGGFKFRETILKLFYVGNDYIEIKAIHVVNEVERVELRTFAGEIP